MVVAEYPFFSSNYFESRFFALPQSTQKRIIKNYRKKEFLNCSRGKSDGSAILIQFNANIPFVCNNILMEFLPTVIYFANQWWSIMERIVLITLLILFSFSAITFCVYFTNTHTQKTHHQWMGDEKCLMWEISMCAHKKVEFAWLTFICEWTPEHAHTSTLMIDNLFHLTLFSCSSTQHRWIFALDLRFFYFFIGRCIWSQNTSPMPLFFVVNLIVVLSHDENRDNGCACKNVPCKVDMDEVMNDWKYHTRKDNKEGKKNVREKWHKRAQMKSISMAIH